MIATYAGDGQLTTQGTLSSRLVENYDIDFISTGDVLRHEIAAGSDVGKEAEKVVASGGEYATPALRHPG